ncbi:hypothetical protein BJV38_003304 [Clostridium beijerinckii]|uniref:hypothetical protein n=1 Tax=Clostridium beijerinckii TaxID=1520 RepID=UPI0015711533|nr:hypothetical protein [Clostridium beijerinckii]NRT34110.1 hypothetical protein [Clostridium beijerinckii]NRT46461.1 hypothetical protein [Clostridium beijerinckii]NRZ19535.1 hypothetical protein [Clostridium beijerinckii]
MWKEQMIKDIEKTKFNPYKLFKNINTNEFITRDEYIDLSLQDFLDKQREIIISLNGLVILNNLERKINHNIEYITLKSDKFNELNCGEKLSQALLTYIYWKYRNPNCIVRDHVNMTYIKKILGFKSKTETIITPIVHDSTCFICGGKTTLTIPSYADNRIIFNCNTCNHTYQTGTDGSYSNDHLKNQYIMCNCKLCSDIKSRIHTKGIEWLNNLEETCTYLIKNGNEYIETPKNNYMQKAYNIYFDNQNNELIKEIFKYTPNSLAELLHITEIISNLYDYDYETVLDELKKINIIFDAKKKTNTDIKIIMLRYLLNSRYTNYVTEEKFNEFKDYILSGDFMLYYEMDKCLDNESEYAIMDYDFDPKLSHFYNILSDINLKKIEDIIYEDSLFANPFFINSYDNKFNLINLINSRIQDYSESRLEFILNTLDSLEKFDNKN